MLIHIPYGAGHRRHDQDDSAHGEERGIQSPKRSAASPPASPRDAPSPGFFVQRQPTSFKRSNSQLVRDPKALETLRTKIWWMTENPNENRQARLWSSVMMTAILVSSFTFIVASLPQFYYSTGVFDVLETVCVTIFTIEYGIRFLTCPSFLDGSKESISAYLWGRLRFAGRFMNFIDLLAILPYYIELIVKAASDGQSDSGASSLAVVRIIRIARVFRLLKLGKNHDGLTILIETMRASHSILLSVLFLVVILQVLFGSLIFYAESGSLCLISWACVGGADNGRDCTILEYEEEDGSSYLLPFSSEKMMGKIGSGQPIRSENKSVPVRSFPDAGICEGASVCEGVGNICFMADGTLTLFNSIPITMWWALVTMCCVGYGDLAPVTTLGQVIGAITAITGVIVLAMPTTVIGTNFSDIYEDFQQAKIDGQEAQEPYSVNQIVDGTPTTPVGGGGGVEGEKSSVGHDASAPRRAPDHSAPRGGGAQPLEGGDEGKEKKKPRYDQMLDLITRYAEEIETAEDWDLTAARVKVARDEVLRQTFENRQWHRPLTL